MAKNKFDNNKDNSKDSLKGKSHVQKTDILADRAVAAQKAGHEKKAERLAQRAENQAEKVKGPKRKAAASRDINRLKKKGLLQSQTPAATGGGTGDGESGGSDSQETSTTPPLPTPPSWITTPPAPNSNQVKQAQPDIIVASNAPSISPETMVELMFEDIGGTELINISRHDIIDGINVSYNPIKNLSALRRRFNPNNIIASSVEASEAFKTFSIDLVSRGMNEPYFDIDGNLIIEIDTTLVGEEIQAEILVNGTINKVEQI